MLCAPGDVPGHATGEVDEGRWLRAVLGESAPGDVLAAESRVLLQQTHVETARQLHGERFEFAPLLPGDEEPLASRTAALGEWCEGFLFGLGLGGLQDLERFPGETREILSDLSELTRIETDPEETDEAEAAYAELVEYVRAAVMLMAEEARPPEPPCATGRLH